MTPCGPILLFPGQGSEAVGMSSGWEVISAWKTTLDAAEGHSGLPLRSWMREGPEPELKRQRHAPHAVIAHSVGIFRAHREAGLLQPVAAAGHSLGYFSMLVAAGVVALEEAMDLVQNTEELADGCFGAGSMGMAFFIGIRVGELRVAMAEEPSLVLSNINGKAQFTVSGPLEALQRLVSRLGPDCLRAGLLPIRQPLHGRHMAPLLPALTRRLSAVKPRDPEFPLYSMCDGRWTLRGDEAWDEAIASVAMPVDWPRVVASLSPVGGEWLECGFGSQLAGLTRWIDRNRVVASLQVHPAAREASQARSPC